MERLGLGVALLATLSVLTACDEPVRAPAPAPEPLRAAPLPAPAPPPVPSALSRDLEDFYKRVEANLRAQGLLRTDGGTSDAPFGAEMLARNFERIALREEYTTVGGRLLQRETESRLHRWNEPVRIAVEFGPRVPPAKASRDRVAVAALAARLSRITGLSMRPVQAEANFHVFVVNEDDRRTLAPRLRALVPGIGAAALETVIGMPRSTYCLVFASDPEDDGTYETAVAVVRSEHPDFLRLSCLHEEIVQGLGLSNDSPEARPSIFNDDEEFGLLTPHDELLLRILYDPRLRAGMTADEARPIVRQIALELVGGDG